MSIVAISQMLGSLGDEIGGELARVLGHEFADRETILKAAEQFSEGVRGFAQLTEGKLTLWECLAESKRRYLTSVEAVIWELAARDNVVIVGRGAAFVLQDVRHALRVRVTAPQHLRVRRVEGQRGLTPDAVELVRQSDREHAARIRFLYDAAWDDPHRYDLVVNTERLDVKGAVQTIRASLEQERYETTPASLAKVRNRSLAASAQAALLRLGSGGQSGDEPGVLAIVRRGAREQFRLLEEAFAGRPARVMWDRRLSEWRAQAPSAPIESAQGERRAQPASSWDALGCVIVGEPRVSRSG